MPWVVAMDWIDAVFLHWRVGPSELRAQIPADLALETFDGAAWASIVAFRIAGARPRGLPRALGLRTFPEINVRTYVTDGVRAGVWFCSLDANNAFAVEAARIGTHLPYYGATIQTAYEPNAATYRLRRTDRRGPSAELDARATFVGTARAAMPGSLEHFLAERYCFFTRDHRGRTMRADVVHEPWPLRNATAIVRANTLLSAVGIVPRSDHFLAHASAGVSTRFWPLRAAGSRPPAGSAAFGPNRVEVAEL